MVIPSWLADERTFTISRPFGGWSLTIYDDSGMFSYTGYARTLRVAAKKALDMRERDSEEDDV